MSEWTDELKEQVIADYEAGEPTPENTGDLVIAIAEDIGKSPNAVRAILTKSGKYITKGSSKPAGEAKEKRKSKQDSLDELTALLDKHNASIDADIINKLTGKAAEAFITSFTTIIEG